METTLSQLKTQIEELEKRIKALSNQVTTQGYMTSMKSCLDQIQTLITTYQTQLTEHLSEYDTHSSQLQSHLQDYSQLSQDVTDIEDDITSINSSLSSISQQLQSHISNYSQLNQNVGDLEDDLSSLSTTITSINSNITSILGQIEDLEDADDSLESRVTSLESQSSSGGSSPGGGTTTPTQKVNRVDTFCSYINGPITGTYEMPRCQFYCDPTIPVVLTYHVKGKVTTTDNTEPYIELYINASNVASSQLIQKYKKYLRGVNGNFEYTDSYQFYPSEKFNFFTIKCKFAATCEMLEYSVKVEGYDVKIVDRELPLRIICFNEAYYILKRSENTKLFYDVQSKDSLNLADNSLMPINNTDLALPIAACYITPTLTQQYGSALAFNTNYSPQFVIVGLEGNSDCHPLSLKKSDSQWVQDEQFGHNTSHIEPIAGGYGYGTDCWFFVSHAGVAGFLGDGINSQFFLKYNNQNILQTSIRQGALVRDNDVKIGDTSVPYRGAILWDKDTCMNTFYPQYNSSYKVDIAKGFDATAYYQRSDNTINVYINRDNNVYKYVLQKNSQTNQYEVGSQVTTFENISRYEELYDGKYIVYRGTDYEIITPST